MATQHTLGQWQPCPTCCPEGCVYFSDNFNRSNNTDLGADWTETAGDWEIVSQTLQIDEADAVLTCDETHPTSSIKYLAAVSARFDTDADIAIVYVDDSNYYVELERVCSNYCRFRLFDATGTPTCVKSVGHSLSVWNRILLCLDGTTLFASLGGGVYLTTDATATSSVVALGTGACTGTVSFEDFALSKHYDDDNTCPRCGNENCIWFSDQGAASGTLSATDYTATGTWDYDGGYIKCTTTDSTLAINIENPSATFEFYATVSLKLIADGDVARLRVDGGGSYLEVTRISSTTGIFRLISGAACLGRLAVTVTTFDGVECILCYDGTTLTARFAVSYTIAADVTLTAGDISIATGQVDSAVYFYSLDVQKHSDDLEGCPTCPDTQCVWFSDNGDTTGSLSALDYTTSGTWDYAGGKIQAGTTDAVATVVPENPEGTLLFHASVTVTLNDDDDVARLRVDGGDKYVEVTRHSGQRTVMRLYSAGVCVGMRNIGSVSVIPLTLCYDGAKLLATARTTYKLSIDVALTTADVSIATGNVTTAVQFDSLILSKHDTDMTGCATCVAEPCEWFIDAGDTSGDAVEASDYTATGTWVYDYLTIWGSTQVGPGLIGTEGTLEIAVPAPYSSKGRFLISGISVWNWTEGAEVRIYYGSDDTTYIRIFDITTPYARSLCADIWCNGVRYGIVAVANEPASNTYVFSFYEAGFCWDGDEFIAHVVSNDRINSTGYVSLPVEPADFAPRIAITDYSSTGILFSTIECYKHGADATPAISCTPCGEVSCPYCAEGTYGYEASFSITGATVLIYGSTCDFSGDLFAGSGCQWGGRVTIGGLGGQLWLVTVTLLPTTGGYILQAYLNRYGSTDQITYEKTFLTASLLDCRVDLDGVIPFHSQVIGAYCDFSTSEFNFTVT